MYKMTKRIFSWCLVLCMIAALVPSVGITAHGAALGENEAIYSVNVNEDGVTDNVIVAEHNGVSYVMGSIASDGKAAAIPAVERDTYGNNIVVDEETAERFTVTSEIYVYPRGSYWLYRLKTESGYLIDHYGIDNTEHKLATAQKETVTNSDEFFIWRKTWEQGWFNYGYSVPVYLVVDGSDISFQLCEETSEAGVEYIKVDIFSKGCQHPDMRYVPAVSPTCKKDGNGAYWYCPDCDSNGYSTYFSDEIGLNGSNNPPITMSYGAVDADHDGVCDDCGKNMPVFKKVTQDSQIVAGGKYILATKVGDQYYAAASGAEQYGNQLPAVAITPSEDGTFSFEETTQAMTIELGFANGCTEWGNGIRYGFITKFNESRSEFAPMGGGEFLFDEYDIRGAKYGFYVGLNEDGTATIHSAYDETDMMRSYTYNEMQHFTSADHSGSEGYTESPVYLYRLTDTGTVNTNSYDMTLVKSETDYSVAIEGGSEAEGGTNIIGVTDALTQTAVDSLVSTFVTDCSISDGEHIQINTSVSVTVTDYSEESSITFSLYPNAVVSGGETTQTYEIPDSDFDGTTPMTVTLYTGGIYPAQVIHEKQDGTKEYFYPEWSKEVQANGEKPFYELYDNSGNMYVSFTVTEFSDVRLVTTPEVDADDDIFAGWSVTLQDDIAVNFHFHIDEADVDSTILNISVAGESYPAISATDASVKDGQYVFTVYFAAAQMTDTIHLELVSGKSTVHSGDYTLRQYTDALLADDTKSEYHALAKEMLNYGAMAQLYFGYNTENIANADITDVAANEVPETAENELSATGITDGIRFHAASLVYRDKIALRFYFEVSGDITAYTFTADGNTYTPVEKDGYYYIEIADISPENLNRQVEVTVTGTGGGSLAVSYSPMNYIVRMNVKGSESLKALLKALYNYHLAAKALKNP